MLSITASVSGTIPYTFMPKAMLYHVSTLFSELGIDIEEASQQQERISIAF